MFTATSSSTTTPPIPIHSQCFFMNRVLLPAPASPWEMRLPAAAAHALDLRLRHPQRRQRRDRVAARPLELHFGVHQLENRRRADVVLLLGEVEILGCRLDAAPRDAV